MAAISPSEQCMMAPESPANIAVEQCDPNRWWERVRYFADASFRQAPAYAHTLAERIGATVECVLVWDHERLVGGACVRVKRIPLLRSGLAYISFGPVAGREPGGFATVVAALRDRYVVGRGLTLRIVGPCGDESWATGAGHTLERAGYTPTRHGRPYLGCAVDLVPTLAEIRSSSSREWKNNLNRAARSGVRVRCADVRAEQDQMVCMYAASQARKGYLAPLDARIFMDIVLRDPSGSLLDVTVAECDGRSVGMHIVSFCGDTAVFALGGLTKNGLEASAGYMLHWHAIQEAKQRGFRWYDLGAVDDSVNPGVARFKRGVSSVTCAAPAPYDSAPDGLAGRSVQAATEIYRRLRAGTRRV